MMQGRYHANGAEHAETLFCEHRELANSVETLAAGDPCGVEPGRPEGYACPSALLSGGCGPPLHPFCLRHGAPDQGRQA